MLIPLTGQCILIYYPRAEVLKVWSRGSLNYTKSGTIVVTKHVILDGKTIKQAFNY